MIGGDILVFLSKIVIYSYVKGPNTYIKGVVNFSQTIFSNKNISKHVACIHYTRNKENNHCILLWMETPKNINNTIISNGCNKNHIILISTQI
jgi:hypothetical protein